MRVKLRQVGNSIGLTIPASELKTLDAEAGDIVEIEIKQVIKTPRSEWEDPARWPGADEEPPLEDTTESDFDRQEWQW